MENMDSKMLHNGCQQIRKILWNAWTVAFVTHNIMSYLLYSRKHRLQVDSALRLKIVSCKIGRNFLVNAKIVNSMVIFQWLCVTQ